MLPHRTLRRSSAAGGLRKKRAMLEPKYAVYHSAVLNASADVVWAELRDIMRLIDIVFGDAVQDARGSRGARQTRFRPYSSSPFCRTTRLFTRRSSHVPSMSVP